MYQKELSNYLSGMMNLASSLSTWIGPSFIEVDCYQKGKDKEEFCKDYHLSKEQLVLEEYQNTLTELLKELLGEDDKLIEALNYWISFRLGKEMKVEEITDDNIMEKLSSSSGGESMFYTVEGLYRIEFSEYVIYIMIGNNE